MAGCKRLGVLQHRLFCLQSLDNVTRNEPQKLLVIYALIYGDPFPADVQ
jgi:hypothetical protein